MSIVPHMSDRLDEDPIIILSKWAQKWLKFGWNIIVEGTPTEQIAKKLLKELDANVDEPHMYVEDHIDERSRLMVRKRKIVEKSVSVETSSEFSKGNGTETKIVDSLEDGEDVVRTVLSRKVIQRLVRKQRSNFAAAVSKKAYNKFGERPMTPANILVTRKWLQKYLEDQFKDLRTCDKNIAIDRALFLSFVPTKDFLKMRVLMETQAAGERMRETNFVGKIFQLRRGEAPL